MASILDRYGIKEVADVTFYEIKEDGSIGAPVLYLDTLKVSSIEQTAETVEARGGKGNPALVSWDFGKEITVNIEDALFSPKSLAIMLGNGKATAPATDYIKRTGVVRTNSEKKLANDYIVADIYDAQQGSVRTKLYLGTVDSSHPVPAGMVQMSDQLKFELTDGTKSGAYHEDGSVLDSAFTSAKLMALTSTANSAIVAGEKLMFTYWLKANATKITVSGDTFPGTYYVTGDTYARSDVSGKDQFFQFIIHKAKMQSENTITLEAEGDPSTFNMSLKVLRDEDGTMMDLVQYDLSDPTA